MTIPQCKLRLEEEVEEEGEESKRKNMVMKKKEEEEAPAFKARASTHGPTTTPTTSKAGEAPCASSVAIPYLWALGSAVRQGTSPAVARA